MLASVSCGGEKSPQDLIRARGYMLLGETSGRIVMGGHASFKTELKEEDCYLFAVMVSEKKAEATLTLRFGGQVIQTVQAAKELTLCPEHSGLHEVEIGIANTDTDVTLTSWRAKKDEANQETDWTGPGSCHAPLQIELTHQSTVSGTGFAGMGLERKTGKVEGSNTGAKDTIRLSCAESGSGSGTDVVVQVVIEKRGQLTLNLKATYDAVLGVLGTCGQSLSEIGCNDDAVAQGGQGHDPMASQLSIVLEPGTYAIVVDAYSNTSGATSASQQGTFSLEATWTEMKPMAEICRGVEPLVPNVAVQGTTAGGANNFQSRCADNAQSSDRAYRFSLESRSRVRLKMQAQGFDGALHLRKDCADMASELACNDDYGDGGVSQISTTLDAGSYVAVVDGFGSGNEGAYSLMLEVYPLGVQGPTSTTPAVAGDMCSNAMPYTLPLNGVLTSNTLPMQDNATGTCGGAGAGDMVYRIDLQRRTRVRAKMPSGGEVPGVMYLRRDCENAGSEIGCVGGTSGTPELDAMLAAGTYYLIVDGINPDAFGEIKVEFSTTDLSHIEQLCRAAPVLRPGQQIASDTSQSQDRHAGTCNGGGSSPDLVYQVNIRRRSKLRVMTETQTFDGMLYIRRDCADAATEIGCNDDSGDNKHSMIEVTVQPGTYYIFVDGYESNQGGRFTLDVDVSAP